ncbi:MAG: dihydropteroate synthase [Gammaproteobacteria bacterium]|nr:dihydropteroate synthase [Gammaproteobacteria bacterium]
MAINKSLSIMGIINLSPDSFFQSLNYSNALKKAEQMAIDGASIIDVGAIATNPKINLESQTPTEQAELDLLIPFIEQLSKKIDITISVDTCRAQVMYESVNAGAKMINDQRALTEENALSTAVALNVPVCLMHWMGVNTDPRPLIPDHNQLLEKIKFDLQNHAQRCLFAGLKKENIIIDPGFGGGNFGKSPDENFYLLAHLKELTDLEFPILVGLSRKSMFSGIQAKAEDRLSASIAAAVIAAQNGASIIRVHDVRETVDAMKVLTRTGSASIN